MLQPYTLDRNYYAKDLIDGFLSIIWTERYYGNSTVELVVPATDDNMDKLLEGVFLGVNGSDELMIIETRSFKDDKMTVNGISLLSWLNNRFIRTSRNHKDRYYYMSYEPGFMLVKLVEDFCLEFSDFLNGTVDIGIPNPLRFVIPRLDTGSALGPPGIISAAIPFGPLYDALYEIATTYEIGMTIIRYVPYGDDPRLSFYTYEGRDRTSTNDDANPVVRFSPFMDTFSNIEELQSIADLKTEVYTYAPADPLGNADTLPPGIAALSGDEHTGFDLRAFQKFEEDITTDLIENSSSTLIEILNNRAKGELLKHSFVRMVDGTVVTDNPYQFGQDYFIGDIVEVQGKTRTINRARVTEFIRSQDNTGYKAYPTLETLASDVDVNRPPNDDFVNAIVIHCPGGSIEGTIRAATSEIGEGAELSTGATVWYKITPGFDTDFTITVTGIGFNPLPADVAFIYVYKDTDPAHPATNVSEATRWHTGSSPLTVSLNEGENYYIAIDSEGSPSSHGLEGDFILAWECEAIEDTSAYEFREIHPATTPSAYFRTGIAYDVARARVVLAPGEDGITWEYYDHNWHAVVTEDYPSYYNIYSDMTYDPVNEVIIQYLHLYDGHDTRQTWKYDGTNWELLITESDTYTLQPEGTEIRTVWNPVSERILAVVADSTVFDAETWEFNVATETWSQLSPAHSPPGTDQDMALCYDSTREKIVLITRRVSGGLTGSSVWEYDPETEDWTQVLDDAATSTTIAGTEIQFDSTVDEIVYVRTNPGMDVNPVSFINASYAWIFQSYSGPGGSSSQICDYPPEGGLLLFGAYNTALNPAGPDTRTYVGKIYD